MNIITSFKTWVSGHLIPEWRSAWKYLSVQASTIGAAIAFAWPMLPEEKQALVLDLFHLNGASTLAAVGFLAIIFARVKAQRSVE